MSECLKQQRVSAAHVMVVGCGALGNEVLKNLVLLGVEHLVVVDFDVVEVGNLSRSVLFSKADADAHRLKVEVVAERLKAMNPAVEIQTICGDVAYDVGLSLIRRMDVVIGCVDSRWARYCINRLCMRAGVPWVDGGIEELEGTARVFIPGKNCYACNLGPEGLRDLAKRMSCTGVIHRHEQAGSAPTTSLMASVIGAVQVQEAMKLVHQEALEQGTFTSLCGKMFYYDGQHLTTKLLDFQAYDDDCAVHTCWTPIRPLALSRHSSVAEVLHLIGQCEAVSVCQYLPDILHTSHHFAPLGILRLEHGVTVDSVELRIVFLTNRVKLRRVLGFLYFDDRVLFKIDQVNAAVVIKKRLQKFIFVFVDHSLSFALLKPGQ